MFELEDRREMVSVIWMGRGGRSASGIGALDVEKDGGKTIRSLGTYFGFPSFGFLRLGLPESFGFPGLGSEELLLGGGGLELVIPLMIAEPNGMDVFFEPFLNASLSPLLPLCCTATNHIR